MFFFFQAEDGIRDVAVTGVQTCALPISRDGGAQVVEAERVGEVALALGHEQVAGVLVVLVATHNVQVVHLAELPPERKQGLRSEEHTSELQSRLQSRMPSSA